MKIDSILELWEEDSKIDRSELGTEALKVAQLHHKYYKIYVNERLVLKKYESDLKVLRLDKYEFFTQGPTKEMKDLGWVLPSIGRIIKSDVNTYMEADKDIINLTLKIGLQHEKVDMLESIIKSINNRNFNLRVALDWEKFKTGG